MSFAKGVHSCLGSVLARMELKITFETLMRKVPNLAPHPSQSPVPKRKTLLFKGFESFPVVF
ncbi:cytochrome P450 [Oscillatoria sp. FACHB-1406]|nr:cytochrome P450 [Oscillatoria sp. FACHB-1406]